MQIARARVCVCVCKHHVHEGVDLGKGALRNQSITSMSY